MAGLFQSFGIAFQMLRLHKLRAFLTMFGVIIGVMSVTIIIMISGGFQFYIKQQFDRLGSDMIMVIFDPGQQKHGSLGAVSGLKNEDVQWVLDHASDVKMVSGLLQVPAQKVMVGEKDVDNPRIFGIDESYMELNRLKVVEGRDFAKADITERRNVAVIGQELKDRLFPGEDPIGKFITFQGATLEVVGIAERIDILGGTNARDVLLPLTTAQEKWIGGRSVSYLMARPKEGVPVKEAMQSIWEALMMRSNNRPIYRMDSYESILGVFGTILTGAGTVLAAIAALSLLVGGIGIMNIMLVSVTERTREVGLRKAVGAKRSSIMGQFLIEAAVLSATGGLIGMGLAWLLGRVVTAITAQMKWPTETGLPTPFPLTAGLLALAFSAMIGVVFGLYPAMSAAKLDPIVALRRE